MTELKDLPVYGLIPVKSFSKRFPEKNFSEFCADIKGFRGNLISNTIEKLVKARTDKIYISTDVPEKIKNNTNYSPPVAYTELYILTRPKELATPEATMDDVVMDFIKQLDIKDNYIITLCQVTSPNWSPHLINYAVEKLKQHNKPVISVNPDYQPNGCFYIFTKEQFMEYQSIYNHNNGIYLVVLEWKESTDIDYIHQLRIAESIARGDADEL